MGKKPILPTLAEAHPELAAMWHPNKNGDLTPDMVTCGSDMKVWWYFSYDDPHTGKHFDFEWKKRIKYQIARPECPFIAGRNLYAGFNDLATKYPDLAAQWHPTKNGGLTPEMATCGCSKKVWWLLPYDDPETGKHFDFEWEERVSVRVDGCGCPFLTGHRVWPGFNDLASRIPKLAKEWHPTKNGDLSPDKVTCESNKKVWWLQAYDDPESGNHFDFEWQANIASRVKGSGCPFLAGIAVWPGFNDLSTKRPDLAKEWHPTLNLHLTPEMVTCGMNKKVWWLVPYDDPETGKHFDFKWQAVISNRTNGNGCPFLSGESVWAGFNDLATKRPDLAKEWHPTLNGDLTPKMVTCGSKQKVWWLLPYDDPQTGKHFDFEWKARINYRVRMENCPFLSGRKVWPGFNDLGTKRPDLAKEWHPTKNGKLTPEMVTTGSRQKIWWLQPYDDPDTGKHFDFEWKMAITHRVRGEGCPFLAGRSTWPGFNDLNTKRPDLAKEWHPMKNGDVTPDMVTPGSQETVWWLLPYDDPKTGKHFELEWRASIASRAGGNGCPFLSGHAVWPGFNDLATKRPDLAKEWHPTKNGDVTPEMVTSRSQETVWWLLPYDDPKTGKHFDFEWQASIANRRDGNGCPFLSGRAVMPGFNDLATKRPDLAEEWHPTKNGDMTPEIVPSRSRETVWWLLPYDDTKTDKHFDFEWQASIASRTDGNGCPYLTGHAVWPGFNDIASQFPEVAKEWHPTLNRRKNPAQTYQYASRKVWWLCPKCGHKWYSAVSARTINERGCPECGRTRNFLT